MEIIKQKSKIIDDRGYIQNLISDNDIYTALIIHSKKGSIRANHYHKTDSHYCFIIKGSMEYYEKELDSNNMSICIIGPGEGIFTPSLKVHAVKFREDSIMLVLSPRTADSSVYEDEIEKVKLI